MGILDEDVARVREATDVVKVIGEHVGLKKVGTRWVGLCPFHAEKTASFSVNAQEGLYYCFGCQAKGDVITFVRQVEGLEFVPAVERLASLAGIQLRYDSGSEGRDKTRRATLLDAVARAEAWYHERLLSSADAAAARGYLRSRGYDGEVVRKYRIGWAPDDWDALARALSLPDDVARDAGLAFVNKRGRQQDVFRSRVMFPIYDVGGVPVAFGGRKLGEVEGPKYKNSPESPVYSKSKTLYGLNWAKADVVTSGEVVVCEGYTDVIGMALVGVPTAVATCGTALADEHFRMLRNFARKVVLAYDADSAGQAAAERFYEWERRYEVDVAVAGLPAGADPADVARGDPESLKRAVAEARPFLAFRLERVLAVADIRSAEGRARAAQAAMAVVSEHPDALVRDQYLMQIAERTRIDPERLRAVAPRRRGAPMTSVEVAAPAVVRGPNPEVEALRLALHHPEVVEGKLHEALFDNELHAAAVRALAGGGSLHDAIERADPGAAALLQRLAVEEADPESDAISLLAQLAARRAVVDLESEAKGSDALDYVPVIGWLQNELGVLMDDDTDKDSRLGARDRLVDWLVKRAQETA